MKGVTGAANVSNPLSGFELQDQQGADVMSATNTPADGRTEV